MNVHFQSTHTHTYTAVNTGVGEVTMWSIAVHCVRGGGGGVVLCCLAFLSKQLMDD